MASSTRRKSLPASPLFTTRMQEKLQQNRHTSTEPINNEDMDALSFAISVSNEYDDALTNVNPSIPTQPLTYYEQVPSLLKRIEEKQSKKKPNPQSQYPFHPSIDPKSAQIGNNYHSPTHHHNIHNYTHTYSPSYSPSPTPTNPNNHLQQYNTRVSPDGRETLKSSVHSANSDETGKTRNQMLYEMDKDRSKHREDMKRESEIKEMAECTFAPNILPTNVPISNTNRDLVGRLHGWHQDKLEKIGKLRVETQNIKDEQSVEGCTFKPTLITPKSPKNDSVSPPHGVNKYLDRQQRAKEKREIAKSAEFHRETFVTENWSSRSTEPQEFKMMIREKLKTPSTTTSPTPNGRRSSSPLTSKQSKLSHTRTPTPTQHQQMRIKNAPRSQSFSAYSAPSTPSEPESKQQYAPKYAGGLISVADVEKIRSLLGAYSVDEDEAEGDGSGVDEGQPEDNTTPHSSLTPLHNHNTLPQQRSAPSPAPSHTSTVPSRSPTPLTTNSLAPSKPAPNHIDIVQKLKAENMAARPNSAPPQLTDPHLLSKAKHSPRATVHPAPLIVRPYHK